MSPVRAPTETLHQKLDEFQHRNVQIYTNSLEYFGNKVLLKNKIIFFICEIKFNHFENVKNVKL